MEKKKYQWLSVISIITVLVVWYLAINVFHLKDESTFPGPLTVFRAFVFKLSHKAPDGATLGQHLMTSLGVTLFGYSFGAIVGIPLGILMAWNKWVDRIVRPVFDLIRPVPGIAWIPMFILLFGIGLLPKAMVIFIGSFIACMVNSYTGIQQTSEKHLWVGEVFGATNAQLLFHVAIPSATPMIFTGLRVGLGSSWTALVGAELLASNKGLGYMIQQSRAIARPDIIIVGMLAIGIVGAVLDKILQIIEQNVAKGMNAK